MQKKILTIEDLSAVGKTSLATAIPIITAFGHESIAIPSALLSANTAFKGFTYLDLTGELLKILTHLNELNVKPDALYTGYLGSAHQINIILDYLNSHEGINYYLDPAMADDGCFYEGFDEKFSLEIKKLIKKALVIMPNITEAKLLLNSNSSDALDLLKPLANLGPRYVIITGIKKANRVFNYGYDKKEDKTFSFSYNILANSYYGTGDLFASLITGAMEKGLSFEKALKLAGDFLHKAIALSNENKVPVEYGVLFEPLLSVLGGENNE